jgi:outer membrane usher protein
VPRLLHLIAALLLSPGLLVAAENSDVFEELVVEVDVNSQGAADMLVVLRDAAGGYWFEEEDFFRLRLRIPAGPVHEQEGRRYFRIGAIAGAQWRLDDAMARLELQLPAAAFLPLKMTALTASSGLPEQAGTGLLLNYQLYGQRAGSDIGGSALADVALFSRFGVLASNATARHFGGEFKGTRLDTTFTRDFPSRLRTLRVGDSVMDPGSWGSALRFAGVQFGSNFAIRPDLITVPLLSATGDAVLPSVVDVFVNNQRVYTDQVKPGPFSVDNLPVITGSGEVQVVVRDALGREQVLSQRFYSSPTLLAPGLNQYSVSLGAVRENYTLRSFDYGNLAGSASFRRGITNYLTLEAHGEYERGTAHVGGMNAAVRVGSLGVINMTVARSGGDQSSGWLRGLGFERNARGISFGGTFDQATSGYRQLGDRSTGVLRFKTRASAHVGANLGFAGNLSLLYVRREYHNFESEQTYGLTHSMRLGNLGSLNLLVTRSLGSGRSTSAFLSYVASWGARRSYETSAESMHSNDDDRVDLRAGAMQSLPVGEGSGWRVSASQKGNYDASWQQRLRTADVEVQAARNFGRSGQSVSLRGGVATMGGVTRAARSVDGSFALVDLDGMADVPVYVENQLVTRTDSRGRALLNNLLAYHPNRISVDPVDLPLDAAINARTMVIQPGYRSGVVARFPVERVHPALFRLVQTGGAAVPTGAEVRFNGGEFVVAKDGLTYVTTLDHGTTGTATWDGGRCVFRLDPPQSGEPLNELGDVVCRAPEVQQ